MTLIKEAMMQKALKLLVVCMAAAPALAMANDVLFPTLPSNPLSINNSPAAATIANNNSSTSTAALPLALRNPSGVNVGDGWIFSVIAGQSTGDFVQNASGSVPSHHFVSGSAQGLQAAYGYTFSNNFYLGAAVNGFYQTTSEVQVLYNNAGQLTNSRNTSLNKMFGISILPGYHFNPDNLVYLRLGYYRGGVTTSTLNFGFANGNTTENIIDYGLGYTAAINANLSLSLEYDYLNYRDKQYLPFIPAQPMEVVLENIYQQLFLIALNYQLDPISTGAVSAQPALCLNGPYTGINFGFKQISDTATRQSSTTNSTISITSLSGTGSLAGLKLGYGYVWDRWLYLGGELGINSNTAAVSYEDRKLARETNQYTISFLPGIVLDPSDLFYARLGLTKTNIQGNAYFYTADQNEPEYNQNWAGYELGLGFETALTSCLSLILEGDFTNYNNKVFSNTANNYNVELQDSTINLGLNFRF